MIDPATAEICRVYGNTCDPYDIAWNDPDQEDWPGGNYFARAPGSDVWVSFSDFSKSASAELWDRDNPAPRPGSLCFGFGRPARVRAL